MTSFPRLALIPAAFLLAACLGGDKGGGPSYSFTEQVIDIDRDAQTITTRETYWFCDEDGQPASETEDWEEGYAIADGKLYTWAEYDCLARIARGSSSDIVGTWTAAPPKVGQIPGGPEEECADWEEAEEEFVNEVARNVTITRKISETKIDNTVTGEVCWAEFYGWLLPYNIWGGEEVQATAQECSSVLLTRESDDRTARITSSQGAGGAIKVKFTTEGATCSATISPEDRSEEPDCSEGIPEEEFTACVTESGYFGTSQIFEKKAAAKALRKHRALRALRAPR